MTTFYDRVRVGVSAAPGVNAIPLGAGSAGYQSFSAAGVADGAVVPYVLEDGNNWEIGHGTYVAAGPTLQRTTIIRSSVGGQMPVNATAQAVIYLALISSDIPKGLPPGGANGQVLTKNSGTDYDVDWRAAAGGSGGGGNVTSPTIVQQAHVYSEANNNDKTVTFGSQPTPGNLLVFLIFGQGGNGVQFTPQSGYTLIAQEIADNSYQAGIVGRTAGANEPAAQLCISGTEQCAIMAYEIAGAMASDITSSALMSIENFASASTFTSTLALPAGAIILGLYADETANGLPTLNSALVSDYADSRYIVNRTATTGTWVFFHSAATGTATASDAQARNGLILLLAMRPKAVTNSLVGLSDVDQSAAPADTQVPTWDAASSKFKFKTPAAGGNSSGSVDRVVASCAVEVSAVGDASNYHNPLTILHKKNITSVTRINWQVYKVTFTNPIPAYCMPVCNAIFGSGGNYAAAPMVVERADGNYTAPNNMTLVSEIVVRGYFGGNGDPNSPNNLGFDVFRFWLKMEDLSIGADA